MRLRLIIIILLLAAAAILFFIPVTTNVSATTAPSNRAALHTDLSTFPDVAPTEPIDLLFIHHSCGGHLLAAPGPDSGTNAIYVTNQNGGGLKSLLESNSYVVHEASYGSAIGQDTDLFHWLPKFRSKMDDILACDMQDERLPEGRRNKVVVFKSCFPNNAFKGEGSAPGNPAGPELTLANAQASFTALLSEFQKHPDVLFVCLTAPPLAAKTHPKPLWKVIARKVLGRADDPVAAAAIARKFNNWLGSPDGWLKSAPKNVALFNYYDLLTGCGSSDFCVYPTGGGYDSHPSQEGNSKAAQDFIPFLNRALNRLKQNQQLSSNTLTYQ